MGAIITALEKDAAKGNANAARELRAWLAEYLPDTGGFDPGVMTREQRHKVYARILAELEEAGVHDLPARIEDR